MKKTKAPPPMPHQFVNLPSLIAAQTITEIRPLRPEHFTDIGRLFDDRIAMELGRRVLAAVNSGEHLILDVNPPDGPGPGIRITGNW